MEYIEKYNFFYSKYYSKTEILIKNYLIKSKANERTYNYSSNKVRAYISEYQQDLFPNSEIKKLQNLFDRRAGYYETNATEKILKNELKDEFDRINKVVNYDYIKYVKTLALYNVLDEISRLLSNNSLLLECFYIKNKFDDFEIKYYKGFDVVNTSIYKKLNEIIVEPKPQKDFEKLVFQTDGLQMFNHLVSNYTAIKNKAFFSHLFFFLQNKNKLISQDNDSIDYRTYIIKNYEIEGFSRIIKDVSSTNQHKKKKIYHCFNEILKSYSEPKK